MNRREFIQYLINNFNLSVEIMELIDSILGFVESHYHNQSEQHDVLHELLDNLRIGLEYNEIEQIRL